MWIKTYDQKRDPGMILGPLGASKRSSNAQKVYTHVGGEFRQYGKSGPIGYSTGTRTDAWPVSVARPTWLRRYGHCLSGIRYGIMEVLYARCCGLDVHKSSITACVLIAQAGKPLKHIRRFGSITRELRQLVAWLHECGSTWRWGPLVSIGNLCVMYLKVSFRSCWPMRSTSRQFPGARQIRRIVSG
jgi:hypothetical protein